MTIALEVENLSVSVAGQHLVGPISFAIEEGGVLVVMGETGAGKSLLAQAIMGALPPALEATGKVVLNGRRIDGLDGRERAALWGRSLSMLPQEPWRALSPLKRAAEQVRETHRLVGRLGIRAAQGMTREDFATLGLSGAEPKLPGMLSGGMAQRVAFAAARAGGAPVLLADEPTKGLDADRRDRVTALLADVAKDGGTVLAITHEVPLARELGGHTLILKDGVLVEEVSTSTVLTTPSSAYAKALLAADPAAWPSPPGVEPGAECLTAEAISIARGGKTLIEGFDLTVHAGDRIAITGPSGCGKTSLLDVIAGLLEPAKGSVERARDIKATGVQKLYQDPPAAFPRQVTLGQTLKDVIRLHSVKWSVIAGLLDRMNVAPDLMDRLPNEVSGGELQRIALARALATAPSVLLADEPTSRLDPITQRQTMMLIAEEAARDRIAVVLVTHDHAVASSWAEKTIALA